MNLRWLPYIVSERQALGLDSIRWKFEPTADESLAQLPGIYTFFVDRDHHLWRGWGEKETGQPAVAKADPLEEIRESYLEVEKPLSLRLRCIMGQPLLKGSFGVKLLFLPPAQQDSSVDLELRGSTDGQPVKDRIDFRGKSGGSSGVISVGHNVAVDNGILTVLIKPLKGRALLCGVVLEPIANPK